MEDKPILIAIVDDHMLFRQGISSIIAEYRDIRIIFDVGNAMEMQQKLSTFPLPDIILMDITMPIMSGYEATLWLKQYYPSITVLALSMLEQDGPIIRMMMNGASGYIIKDSRAADLVRAIRVTKEQGYYINDIVSGKLLRSIHKNSIDPDPVKQLPANERKFLFHCCSELTYKEIADKMCLSPHTIDNYRESLFRKFDIRSRTGLALFALRHQLAEI